MNIARVFPRRTNATPTDELAFIDCPPPLLILPAFDEVHISVAFTYDLPRAEWLAKEWEAAGKPIKIGGPALNEPGGEFTPGLYLKQGYVITSRGCPNNCWFCSVPKREGALRELPITEGYNVLDDNLLACSEAHIKGVFEMLKRQKERPVLTGGLEAARLKSWHVELMREAKVKHMFFAYDTPNDYEPLVQAGKLLRDGGITQTSHAAACYVLIGYEGDTFEAAEQRLMQTINAGFKPYAMLFRDESGETSLQWRKFQRLWIVPEIVTQKMRAAWA